MKYTGYKLLMLFQKLGNILIWKTNGIQKNLILFDHHIVGNSQIWCPKKLTSKKLYLILVNANLVKTAAQDYFQNLF